MTASSPPPLRRRSAGEDTGEDVRADLLVMGAALSWLRTESVIGTTAERLLRFSPVPVLTVTRKAVASESILACAKESLAGTVAPG